MESTDNACSFIEMKIESTDNTCNDMEYGQYRYRVRTIQMVRTDNTCRFIEIESTHECFNDI
jgi:hypothetical protein